MCILKGGKLQGRSHGEVKGDISLDSIDVPSINFQEILFDMYIKCNF